MDIVSRAAWGARPPRSRTKVSWGQRTEVIVHYSEGPTSQTVRSIQDFHMDGRGWADVGYNVLVDAGGRIYEGRGWLVVGAHAPGHNTSGIGVCMIGRDGDATPAAKRSIRAVYDEACRRAGRRLTMLGHRDVYATSCPGDDLYAWVRAGMPADVEEDDMPSAEDLWEWDGIPAPRTASTIKTNPTWKGSSYLRDINERVRDLQKTVAAQAATIDKLADALAVAQPDLDALKAEIRQAIEGISVRLDVEDVEDEG